ncbi:f-box domain-containing protein [Ophiostoma piceae UAMH 11346]|uniref:F-box domain-containing protein n=1 Tax=Ophiostoma piceae (strain UAMH 11346) TaxID=1262450 RepID=S3CJJ3_OPHP1|nr:f-box domain-containing protein [Ophiostoma piceae UAMH 11346]
MAFPLACPQHGTSPRDPSLSASLESISSPLTSPSTSPSPTHTTNDSTTKKDSTAPTRRLQLMDLPTELHVQIAQYLIYPDALSLKHTSRYYYDFVDTGIELKIDWLVARRLLHLDCPNDTRCDLGSDLRFCRGSVPLLMKRRREHIECESRPGLGCLIYDTATCVHRRRGLSSLNFWLRRRLTIEMWWVLLALVPVVLSWMWLVELFGLV